MCETCAPNTIANSSLSIFAYIFSGGVNVFELKATGLPSCMITAPRPVLLASTLSTVSLLLSKYANTGALVMTDLNLSKASCCGFSQTNATSFWVAVKLALVDWLCVQ